ncbi:thioredoxin family protein [Lacinutrix sp. 5H-3-7-4]|uniref:thioredoxin family protein n=1 Tax=Lacinutrix sp. (strain 5H-3-7-4) TaxID=983544 RepID=UPI00020A3AA2|nr:thioredoxin family protein [Lacinutrix sp. 5H-3-7-4]AEH02042.1 protein disulfide isomerase [Lacinutrix sp. 5H-3-7-4]
MRNLLLILSICISTIGFSQEEEISNLNWLLDLEEAKQESLSSNKPILIYFTGSDWCGPCKLLKKDFFNTDAFEEKAKHFVLLKVDMPRRIDIITPEQKVKNKLLVKKYNKNGGYPNLVVLNKNLNVIGELSGYTFLRETDRHFAFIDGIIEKY